MLYEDVTEQILGCSFDVINELGSGFLESVYQKALIIALEEKGLYVESEKRLSVYFRGRQIGAFDADLLVNHSVIVELKCCKNLASEHSAQVINYLKATGIAVGLLINFGNKKLEFKRLYIPTHDEMNKIVHMEPKQDWQSTEHKQDWQNTKHKQDWQDN